MKKTKIKATTIFIFILSGCSSSVKTPEQTALLCYDKDKKIEHFFSKKFEVSDEKFLKDSLYEARKRNLNTEQMKCNFIPESRIPRDELT
jgi:protein involved in sex pheromone biosynthesis